MKLRWAILLGAGVLSVLFATIYFAPTHPASTRRGWRSAVEWQRMASPGELTKPHAFLDHNCSACHTPIKGVEAKNCIVCHADNKAVLQREPTAFHSDIAACSPCHLEHRGPLARTTTMDHVALSRIAQWQLQSAPAGRDDARDRLIAWITQGPPPHSTSQLQREESRLNCATCHQTKDRHLGLFGSDCAQCHATAQWTIPEFYHPSPASQSCAQCHQAPPSHYMEHFKMISMTVAGQPHANVSQCFFCHQTTTWNDIKGVGFYKHH